jgi:hypothetical protein
MKNLNINDSQRRMAGKAYKEAFSKQREEI